MDFAHSADPAVQRQLDRLTLLSPGRDILGLQRITTLLARLGDPQLRLPPAFHVAGTNGKGSTCAFLRAMLEAAGKRVHVYSSPHLVRFNERIRLAGRLIDDALLAPLLEEVLAVAGDLQASFFEVTTAAAFLAFARTPADACVIEVGLGGRLDATNVIPAPVVCGIAQLGIDHQAFLGDKAEQIAAEKAGIVRAGVPLVTLAYSASVADSVRTVAAAAGAPVHSLGEGWTIDEQPFAYRDPFGTVPLPEPGLAGAHQHLNAALAVAMVRHQQAIAVSDSAIATGIAATRWPARLQPLDHGTLAAMLPPGTTLLLDGGHNPAAAEALAIHLGGQHVTMILGMLANKDAESFLGLLAPMIARLVAVPVPDHDHHPPATIAATAAALGIPATTAADLPAALTIAASPTTGATAESRERSGARPVANARPAAHMPPVAGTIPADSAAPNGYAPPDDGVAAIGGAIQTGSTAQSNTRPPADLSAPAASTAPATATPPATSTAPAARTAFAASTGPMARTVLIAGSLYLAGVALALNGTPPD
ncbi:glutamate ligase domain-containing protein [Sphingomonas flavalba]|uniref:bifunctional folylpolyglutamate synthase/dihydrofolate synthase n=1 Tax=Sphingomonas flavalba TaxID=2559804 RepID=UPI0039E0E0B2